MQQDVCRTGTGARRPELTNADVSLTRVVSPTRSPMVAAWKEVSAAGDHGPRQPAQPAESRGEEHAVDGVSCWLYRLLVTLHAAAWLFAAARRCSAAGNFSGCGHSRPPHGIAVPVRR